jgi:rSAM/selenodomain-associated transferase 1
VNPRVKRSALVVLAKAPRPRLVKTRLCPPLEPEQAAALYECMLDDVLEESAAACSAAGSALYVTVYPDDAAPSIAQRVPSSARVLVQRGADLAARMQYAIAQAAAAGFEQIVLRGSDSPALPRSSIVQAFDALVGSDLALSRDVDGGYALLAVRRPHPGLLDHAMSTDSVANDTLSNATRMGLRCRELEPGFDLDTADDLVRLQQARPQLPPGLCRRTLARLDAEDWWPR